MPSASARLTIEAMIAPLRLPGCRAAHEGLVDLDLVEGRRAQIAERRIARAEIVERQAHADGLELLEHLVGALVVVEEHAFGDFQFEPRGSTRAWARQK
jgi:hypothetical protein